MHMHHTARTACACTALRKASRAVTRLYDEALNGTGMTIVQFSVLRNLEREGTLPLIRLADLLVMERTTLYRALTPLERHGWVAITDGNGRAKTATLTPAGAQAVKATTGVWEKAQQRLLASIGVKDWALLEGALDRLVSTTQRLGS